MRSKDRPPSFRWHRVNTTSSLSHPPAPGLYAVFSGHRLLYLGSSSNVRRRLSQHNIRWSYGNSLFTPWGEFPRIEIRVRVIRRAGDWLRREYLLVRRLRPEFCRIRHEGKQNRWERSLSARCGSLS